MVFTSEELALIRVACHTKAKDIIRHVKEKSAPKEALEHAKKYESIVSKAEREEVAH